MESKKETFTIYPIGCVRRTNGKIQIEIAEPYRPGLKQLSHFGHVQVFCWFNYVDTDEYRQVLQSKPPYDDDTPVTGVFASRSPVRPNPIALTTAQILGIDEAAGTVTINNIDALDGTPVIDLKAYFPVCDRVKAFKVPEWVAGWPEWLPEEGIGLEEGEEG